MYIHDTSTHQAKYTHYVYTSFYMHAKQIIRMLFIVV